jgi:Rrf2 family iron-sulfur cluster assembly transcriptional regulator
LAKKVSAIQQKGEVSAVKLSTKGRYAVMAMADLACHSDDNTPDEENVHALAGIAERQEISLAYLEQLFAKLRRAGLVSGVRGPRGGFKLAKDADELRIADIVLAVDEPLKATRCGSQGKAGCLKQSGRCLTHDLWDELGAQIEFFLSSVTLADVIERRVRDRAQELTRPTAKLDAHAAA